MRIIFFDIDCLRPDHMGCYGYPRPTTPAMDAIAADGLRFDRYYCATSPCLPSRTAWISGQLGIHTGVVSNTGIGARFSLQQTHARQGGRHEGDILRVPEMMPRHLRLHGMDTITISNFADRHLANWFLYGWTETHSVNLKGGRECAPDVTARAIHWLRNNRDRDDYFLHINFWDAHRCYKMDAAWAERFKDSPLPIDWPDEETVRAHQDMSGLFTAHGQFPDDSSPFPLMPGAINTRGDVNHLLNGYDAAIAYVDHHVRLVLNELEAQGILDDAVLIVSADHGDAFGEHGIYADHVTVDECIQHIPLIVRWPGVTEGAMGHCDEMVLNTDFYPTLCRLLGIPEPEQIDGASFAECLHGNPGPERNALVWDSANYTVQRAVRTPTHLYIRTYDDAGHGMRPEELYAITADPHQTYDLVTEQPEIVKQCQATLAQWLEEQQAKPTAREDPVQAVLAERGKA